MSCVIVDAFIVHAITSSGINAGKARYLELRRSPSAASAVARVCQGVGTRTLIFEGDRVLRGPQKICDGHP